jgi:glycogen debranching enzyme
MDARVGGRVVTPRIGKPVEVQALWINALEIAGRLDPELLVRAKKARASFLARFWNDEQGSLHDVVDVDHVAGACDGTLRPNQLLAVGGLPFPIVSGEHARKVLDIVEHHLLVPAGVRTLAPFEPGYTGTYGGGVRERDSAYHQGTAWPWLLHAYASACARVRPHEQACEDIDRILAALEAHLDEAGLGHVSEVLSGDAPHAPGGCPFQAWSLGALLRVQALRTQLRATVEAGVGQ